MTKHIIICFGNRRRIIALPSSYNSLLKVARKQFPNMGSIYSLVALYQPQDFKGTVDHVCWVELDETAYSALHDRAILHFNVQHPITKEYMLPLPNTDPDAQEKLQATFFEEVPLVGSMNPSRTKNTEDNNTQDITSVPVNYRDDGNACTSGWGGASERFRRSAKYIPNVQECKAAVGLAVGQSAAPKITKTEETAEHLKSEPEQNFPVYQPHHQHQHREPRSSTCAPYCWCKLCTNKMASGKVPPNQKTVFDREDVSDIEVIDVVPVPQNDGWGVNSGWNNVGDAYTPGVPAPITQKNDPDETFKQTTTSGYCGWTHSSFPDFEDEDLGEPFDSSTPARGRAPGAVSGAWGAPPVHNDGEGWGQPPSNPSVQYSRDQGLFSFINQQNGPKAENDDCRGYGEWNTGRQTHQFRSNPPTALSPLAWSPSSTTFAPAPQMGWRRVGDEQQHHATTWSPERQKHQQQQSSRGRQQKQQEKNEKNQRSHHPANYRNSSPKRQTQPVQPPSQYWRFAKPQEAKKETDRDHDVATKKKQLEEKAYDTDATITDPNRTETDNSNATLNDCEHGHRDDIPRCGGWKPHLPNSSHSQQYEAVNNYPAADPFRGQPSKGWGKAASADKAT